MRIKKPKKAVFTPPKVIGYLGPVWLVKNSDGRHNLVGGTFEQRTAVRAWCACFAESVVFSGQQAQEIILTA